jgi:hypothetical protein
MRCRIGVYVVRLALATCLLAGGCGGTSGGATAVTRTTARLTTTTTLPTATGPQLSGGYLARETNGGIFVQITMTTAPTFEGSVSLHLEYADETVDERNHFTGVLDMSAIAFHFDDHPDWRWGSSWSGFLDGEGFTVQLPTGEGTLMTAEFRNASVDDYHAAVEQARPRKP